MGVDIPGFAMGTFPVRNFRTNDLEGWDKLSFLQYAAITQKHSGCYACMLKCGKTRTVTEGPYAGVNSEGPHYETIWAFTGPTGCTDLGATVKADYMCCELGLDSISTGNSIGFAYELFEKGILTTKDTDGLVLKYGDPEPMLKLVEKIGRREGLGDILAEGVKRAAEHIGKGSAEYAMHVKGLEMPGYEPRAMKALGMNYALSNTGANHCYGYAQQEMGNPRPRLVDAAADEGKGDIVKYNQDYVAAIELTNACTFPANNLELFGPELIANMLVAALGETKFGSADYLGHVGEKVYNLERCFNIRDGFSRKDDTLPKRMYTEPLQGGMRDGEIIRKPDVIIDEYYEARGWDKNGIPTKATLKRLGLETVDKDIAKFRR
jgi:aldehyde:ferredoxin oxidoreductase